MTPRTGDSPAVCAVASRDETAPPAPPQWQFDTRKFLAIPVVFATIFGIASANDTPSPTVLVYGGIGGAALSLAIVRARRGGELRAVLAGFGVGILVGLPTGLIPCGGSPGLFIGPAVGLFAHRIIRRSAASFLKEHPYDSEFVGLPHGPKSGGRAGDDGPDRGLP
jgi:hypothetical protein